MMVALLIGQVRTECTCLGTQVGNPYLWYSESQYVCLAIFKQDITCNDKGQSAL